MILLFDADGRVLLKRRPPTGVWGGLWSLPETDPAQDPLEWCRDVLACSARRRGDRPIVRHGFTHFDLQIRPAALDVVAGTARLMDDDDWLWYNPRLPSPVGLPAVVTRLLDDAAADARRKR